MMNYNAEKLIICATFCKDICIWLILSSEKVAIAIAFSNQCTVHTF